MFLTNSADGVSSLQTVPAVRRSQHWEGLSYGKVLVSEWSHVKFCFQSIVEWSIVIHAQCVVCPEVELGSLDFGCLDARTCGSLQVWRFRMFTRVEVSINGPELKKILSSTVELAYHATFVHLNHTS